jgi:AcrR family transcriptional regulator
MFSFEETEGLGKGERTRRRILAAAMSSFVAHGYDSTTLRDIAARAEISLGLTYRYFSSKEALVLTLYGDLATRFEARAATLPAGTLGARFAAAMLHKLRLVEPYRGPLGALFRAQLDPQSRIAVLGDEARETRELGASVFRAVVTGATDAPPEPAARDLGALLYAVHLGILLYWQHDPSRGHRRTRELVSFVGEALEAAAPFLAIPVAATALARLARLADAPARPGVAKKPSRSGARKRERRNPS